jgi:hypothetical protein
VADDPLPNFAGDVHRSLANVMLKALHPHSTLAFTSPQPPPAWAEADFEGRLAYIITTEDKAVPEAAQQAMIAGTGKEWIIKKMVSSHCAPFLSRIPEFVTQLNAIVGEFTKAC